LLLTLPVAAVFAWRQRAAKEGRRLCPGNLVGGLALGLLAPAAGLLLGCLPPSDHSARTEMLAPLDLLRQPLAVPPSDWKPLVPFESRQLEKWCWPTPWATLPLSVWGIWCTLRRGKWDLNRRRAPLAWVLTLYTILDVVAAGLSQDGLALQVLSLATLTVLLAVFGVGDVFRNIWDQLRLAPPHERADEP
jgi:hypothetical protein